MGSPVSPIVANLCMEEIEDLAALSTSSMPPTKWFRYVDDVFSIIKKHALTNFYKLLNSINPHINFTIEQELDEKLSFSDTLVTCNNGSLSIDVYRKPTHTAKYLDYNSHHDKRHKVSTAQTLLHRAATLPNTEEGKQQERKHVTHTLMSNGYPKKFLQQVEQKRVMFKNRTPPPEELVRSFFELVEPKTNRSYAVLPYIKGLTEPLRRILKPHDIRVTTKPLRTLEQMFPSTKDRPVPENQTNVVYQINCSDCSWSYVGETGRAFITRKKEHEQNVKNARLALISRIRRGQTTTELILRTEK